MPRPPASSPPPAPRSGPRADSSWRSPGARPRRRSMCCSPARRGPAGSTGCASTSSGATNAACRPTTRRATTGWRARRCSHTCPSPSVTSIASAARTTPAAPRRRTSGCSARRSPRRSARRGVRRARASTSSSSAWATTGTPPRSSRAGRRSGRPSGGSWPSASMRSRCGGGRSRPAGSTPPPRARSSPPAPRRPPCCAARSRGPPRPPPRPNPRDPHLLAVSSFLVNYPFANRLFPGSLDVLEHLAAFGPTVILSDGDVVFQPRKVERSGLFDAVDGRVLIYIHKERELADVEGRFPADHYVLIDDKLRILTAVKGRWGDRLTTVFPRQGHYAHAAEVATYPPADITVERIGDLLAYDLPALLQPARAREAR